MTVETVKACIAADVVRLKAEAAALIAGGMTEQESREAGAFLQVCQAESRWDEFTPAHAQKLALGNKIDQIADYRETLAADLMHCPARYLVTDARLFKPAGVKPEDRVFRKNAVMINADRLPKAGYGLHYYDLDA